MVDGRRLTEAAGILRATDVSVEKPAGLFRVAVLGDSISAMVSLRSDPAARAFPDVLQSRLDRPDRPVEVLNFAVDGYGTLQEARVLESRALRYDPDLVLVQYCLNDPATSYRPAVWFLPDERPVFYLLGFLRSVFRRERVDEFNPRHSRYAPVIGPVTQEARGYWRRMYDPESTGWARVTTGFERIAAAARGKGIPVVLVVFPLLLPGSERDPMVVEIHRMVGESAARHGFHVLDLRGAFAGHPVEALQDFPPWDVYHPSALGHRVAAGAIAAFLAERGLVEPEK